MSDFKSVNSSESSNIRIYYEGDSFFHDLLQAIDAAKSEILFETYIFSDDEIGRKVLNALRRAKERGVIVRLLVDGVGSYFGSSAIAQFCIRHDISYRIFHPTFAQRSAHFAAWRPIGTYLRIMNIRDHRKMTLIDGQLVFTGSMNVTKWHLASLVGLQAWRDTGVRYFHSEGLPELRRSFRRTWLRSRGLKRRKLRILRRLRAKKEDILNLIHRKSRFRLNDGLRQRIFLWRDLRHRLRHAEKRILITNAYFLPKASLLRSFRHAAKRGVFVGICIPFKTDVWMVREAGRVMLRKLLLDGVHVYEYQPAMLHAKTMVIDNWATIGSHNLNHRSIIHDLEIDFVMTESECITNMVQQWDRDLEDSHTMTLGELDQDSLLRRLIGRICYLLRYWM